MSASPGKVRQNADGAYESEIEMRVENWREIDWSALAPPEPPKATIRFTDLAGHTHEVTGAIIVSASRRPDTLVTVHATALVVPDALWLLASVDGEPRALTVPMAVVARDGWPAAFARYRMAFDDRGVVERLELVP